MEDAENPNENTRLYVIGDIHGRLDLLERVIAAIARDVEEHGSDALTVTLGDYIDRGPASCGVIGRLSDNPFPTPKILSSIRCCDGSSPIRAGRSSAFSGA